MTFVIFLISCIFIFIMLSYLKNTIPIIRFTKIANAVITAYSQYQIFLYLNENHEENNIQEIFEFEYGKYCIQIQNKEEANSVFSQIAEEALEYYDDLNESLENIADMTDLVIYKEALIEIRRETRMAKFLG